MRNVKLQDICLIEKGKQIDTNQLLSKNTYKYINGGIKESGYYTEFNTPANTNIISEGGASCGYVNFVDEKFWCGCHCYRLLNPSVKPKYLYYLLKANQEKIMELRTGACMPNIRKDILKNFIVKIEEDDEKQEQIIKIFDHICGILDKRQQSLYKLDELVKSQFIEMFGDVNTNPKKWAMAKLQDVCSSIVRGPFGSALKKDFFVEKDETTYKVYEQKNAIQKSDKLGTYYITKEKYEELKRFECKPHDFIMSCSGTMGELYQLPETSERGIINQALCKFTLNKKINPIVFLEFMKDAIRNIETKGSGIQNIASVVYIKNLDVYLPPIELQNQFADFVKHIDKLKFRKNITKLRNICYNIFNFEKFNMQREVKNG